MHGPPILCACYKLNEASSWLSHALYEIFSVTTTINPTHFKHSLISSIGRRKLTFDDENTKKWTWSSTREEMEGLHASSLLRHHPSYAALWYIYIYNYFSSLSFWVFKLIKKNYKIYLYLWIYININLLLYTIAVVGIYGALEPSVNGSSQEQVLSKGRRNFTASATNLVTSTTGI